MTQTHDEDNNIGMSRRSLMRRSAAATVAVGSVGYGSLRLDNGPVQNSQAIAPVVAAGALGGAAAIGWALRETEVLGSDEPPEGETPESLELKTIESLKARASNNRSTFVDNRNIVQNIEQTAYSDAKIAATDAINRDESKSVAVEDARTELEDYHTTLQTNLINSWDESVAELDKFANAIDSSDLSADVLQAASVDSDGNVTAENVLPNAETYLKPYTQTLADGSEVEMNSLSHDNTRYYPGKDLSSEDELYGVFVEKQDVQYEGPEYSGLSKFIDEYISSTEDTLDFPPEFEPNFCYLQVVLWSEIWDGFEDVFSKVDSEIENWVDNVYDTLNTDELDTSDLLTSREQASMRSEDADLPQSTADLQALNIGTDTDGEAEIRIIESDVTLTGQLAFSGSDEITTGTVDPNSLDGTVYFTYDVGQGSGLLSSADYRVSSDYLTLTFEIDPDPDTVYFVQTDDGQEIELVLEDFSENSDGEFEYGFESEIDGITEITFFSESDEVDYETITLNSEFEIISLSDGDGNDVDNVEFERDEPHDDTNYISEDEWQEQIDRQQELIDKYEESQSSGGISFGNSDSQLLAGAAAAGALIIALLGR